MADICTLCENSQKSVRYVGKILIHLSLGFLSFGCIAFIRTKQFVIQDHSKMLQYNKIKFHHTVRARCYKYPCRREFFDKINIIKTLQIQETIHKTFGIIKKKTLTVCTQLGSTARKTVSKNQ